MTSIEECRKVTAAWQERLGLSGWRVYVRWGRKAEMERDGDPCHGNIQWFIEEDSALLLLSRSSDDLEGTIIHELLHLNLEGAKPVTSRYDPAYERGLNRIAVALKASGRSNHL